MNKITQVGSIGVCILFLLSLIPMSSVSADTLCVPVHGSDEHLEPSLLDVSYIYNLTARLSNIIFTEYAEESGELAKGRAFGTRGEHKAAEILAENMSKFGLITNLEQLGPRPGVVDDHIAHKLEVTDYQIKINDQPVEGYIAPSWVTPQGFNYTFSCDDLQLIPLPRYPCYLPPGLLRIEEDFVFITQDLWNYPSRGLPFVDCFKSMVNPLKHYMMFHITNLLHLKFHTALWQKLSSQCKGLILYDFNDCCYDMIYFPENGNMLPILFINGSLGAQLYQNSTNYTLDYTLTQRYNTSVKSYNVIGELPGKDPSKTVILSCLYDCWWNQGTADSAIGMSIVLAIAKYFHEHHLQPQYTLKFIGFSGEEYDLRGAYYYESMHKDEDIFAIIDLNQLGFTQEHPRLTLDIVANKRRFLTEVWDVAQQSDYVQRTGNVTDIMPIWWPSDSVPSNAAAFALNRPRCNALCFFKDGGWTLHHRTGMDHHEGDVLSYFNWTDVAVTGEMILNITRHVTGCSTDRTNDLPELPIMNVMAPIFNSLRRQ